MNKAYMTSGEFAKLCDTSKETLRHYKNIGLLIPTYEGDNGYQYYDTEQFYDYYAISIFKMTGTPLSEIKECMNHQNIPSILNTLINQKAALAIERKKLEEMEFIVKNSILNMSMGLALNPEDFTPHIAFFEKEHLLAIPRDEFLISKEDQKDEDRILISVLRKYKEICTHYNVQTDYQLGGIKQLNNQLLTHIYTKVNKSYKNPYYRQKTAGNYLYIIKKGDWDISDAFETFLHYIELNKIKTIGDIYLYDLAGFMINGIQENSMTIISIQVL